jgi:hypothetical protein
LSPLPGGLGQVQTEQMDGALAAPASLAPPVRGNKDHLRRASDFEDEVRLGTESRVRGGRRPGAAQLVTVCEGQCHSWCHPSLQIALEAGICPSTLLPKASWLREAKGLVQSHTANGHFVTLLLCPFPSPPLQRVFSL